MVKFRKTFSDYKKFEDSYTRLDEKDRFLWAAGFSKEMLEIKNKSGSTVAHRLARDRNLPEEKMTEDILRLKGEYGDTVAHYSARESALPRSKMTDEVLRIESDNGCTVAYDLARIARLPPDLVTESVLCLRGSNRETVAHALARNGELPLLMMTDDVLRYRDEDNTTVAHYLAECGSLPVSFMTADILSMKNDMDVYVVSNLIKIIFFYGHWELLYPELLTQKYYTEDEGEKTDEKNTMMSMALNDLSDITEHTLQKILRQIEESLTLIYLCSEDISLQNGIDLLTGIKSKIAEQKILEDSGENGEVFPDFYFAENER